MRENIWRHKTKKKKYCIEYNNTFEKIKKIKRKLKVFGMA